MEGRHRHSPRALVLFLAVALLGFAGARLLARSLPAPQSPHPDHLHLVLLGTTDLHAHLEPIDYANNRPANLGLAKIATLIREVRKRERHVLLLDSGDTIEGTPFGYVAARRDASRPNPMMLAMNALGYTAMAVGNHEFDFGIGVLRQVRDQARFPFLSANIRAACGDCRDDFRPYVIRNVAGVRVAIVGLTTPGVPRWEPPQNYAGYTFEPIVATARRIIPRLHRKADLVVVITHSGLGPDPAARGARNSTEEGYAGENAVLALAEQVPGIDVILFGHTHKELAGRTVGGALLVQAKNWGESLARVDIELRREANGRWRVERKRSRLIPVTRDTPPDPEIQRLAEPYERDTQAYLETPVATCARALDGSAARFQDSPLVDLIQEAQLAASHADVSLATMFDPSLRFPSGRVSVRQIAGLYSYEDQLYAVVMTGAQLRRALEHAASFYPDWPPQPGRPMRVPGFNADSAAGVSYTINLRRPVGHRIVDLRYHGAPLRPDTRLRVALNSYRYAGGGGYEFRGSPIVYRSARDIRQILIDYVTRTGAIPTRANGNWRIVPQAAVNTMILAARTREDSAKQSSASKYGLRRSENHPGGRIGGWADGFGPRSDERSKQGPESY